MTVLSVTLVIIPLFLATFILRSLGRVINRDLYTSDVFSHLILIKKIKQARSLRIFSDYILDIHYQELITYPLLMQAILSFLPSRVIEKLERYISPFISSLDLTIVYLFFLYWTQDYFLSALAATFYLITPVIHSEFMFLTPRSFGILFVNIALSCMVSSNLEPWWGFFVVASIIGIGIFLLHKFTAQAFLVGTLSILVVADHKLGILAILALILFSLTIPLRRLYLERVFRGHVKVLKWHYRNPRKLGVSPIRLLFGEIWNTPLMVPLVAFFITNPDFFLESALHRMLFAWILGFFLMAWAVKYFTKLRFLGEGNRYKYHAVMPIALLTVSYWYNNPQLWTLALLLGAGLLSVGGVAREIVLVAKRHPHSVKELRALCNRLRKMSKDRVWVLGYGLGPDVAYWTEKKVLAEAALLNVEAFLENSDLFPVLSKPYTYIIERFSINYLLVDDQFLDLSQVDLGFYREIAREGRYRLLEVLREGVP